MRVFNPSSTKAVVLSDTRQVGDAQQPQWQDGIKSVTVSPLGTVAIRNEEAGNSAALLSALSSGTLRVVTPNDTTSSATFDTVPGLVTGVGNAAVVGMYVVPIGKKLYIAFGGSFTPAVPSAADIIKLVPGYTNGDGTAVNAFTDIKLVYNTAVEGAVIAVDATNGSIPAVVLDNSAGVAVSKTALLILA